MTTLVSVDFETRLITQEEPIPAPVVLSFCYDDYSQDLIHARDPACKRMMRCLLEEEDHSISGFYVAYDMMVAATHFDLWEQVWAKYDAGQVHCTRARQKLIDIARGEYRGYRNGLNDKYTKFEYNLESVAPRWGIEKVDADEWRLRYAELMDVDLEDWPKPARAYPLRDTEADMTIWQGQEAKYSYFLENAIWQADKSFCLAIISRNGLRTSKFMVGKYRQFVQDKLDEYRDLLVDRGFLIQKTKGKDAGKWKKEQKKMQLYAAAWCRNRGIEMPTTETGGPCLDEEAAKKYKNKLITAYQAFGSASTMMDRVEELEAGANGLRIHTRFDELMKSGRSSSSKPNIQNRSTKPGDRECIIPDPGHLIAGADADGLELRTVAQSCINIVGYSRLAEFLNAGEDPHLEVAARLVGCTYDEAKVRYKQDDPEIIDARGAGKAKMVNFSSWAGTSVKGLNYHAKEAGIPQTMVESEAIYQAFLEAWPEASEYFKWVRAQGGQSGYATLCLHQSNRYAGLLTYTETCSMPSQGLGADATGEALKLLVRLTERANRHSLLHGCPVLNYIHDEFHIQVPDDYTAHDRAVAMAEVFCQGMAVWLPDVPPKSKPYLTRRCSKMAKSVYDKNGRLVPWDFDMLGPMDPRGRPWPANVAAVRSWVIAEKQLMMKGAAE